ncbi:MAG: cation-translocating P-type ATPase, partial [Duncaniella sp.]|nr:cation-translocating P-type ATPase [Duncaniella sp.]
VICTDKTGTLTQHRMQVADACFPALAGGHIDDSSSAHTIAEGIAVNSTAQLDMTDPSHPVALGNPTEGALLLWLHSAGLDYLALREGVSVVEELPFTTERKYMATLVRDRRGHHIIYVKGAPEIVAAMCGVFPQGMDAASVDARLLGYQRQGMRTLGFACVELPDGYASGLDSLAGLKSHMELLGIVAISDPVRHDVPEAVNLVRHAGIDVKIVTGDTPATAREIGREIGLWSDADTDRGIITGSEFAALSDDELRRRVDGLKIIARARPMDKKRLVEALQANNEVVAVTGDGTNDAPALKAAHVGLSMGDGTAVAKEASDITIIDNSFSSIGKAVMWGRSLYLNIQRFILFQLTVNVVASLIVLAGAFMGMQSPLTVTQMLWVNLIMDTFAAIALSTLPPSADVMDEKPRSRSAFIISPAMGWFIAVVGGLFFVLLFGLLWYLRHTDLNSLTNLFRLPLLSSDKGLSPYELSLFFTTFVFLQFWNLFNAKAFATGRSALHFKGCSEFVTIALFILVGQVCIVEIGRQFFNVEPLRLSDWIIIICGTSIVLWVGEIIRLFGRKRKNV